MYITVKNLIIGTIIYEITFDQITNTEKMDPNENQQ